MDAQTIPQKAKADNMLAGTLKSLFAVSENYPTLKANENFIQLQEELTGTENKIAYARQHYNDMVMEFNTKIEVFPNNMFASWLKFTKMDSFVVTDAAQREPVKVQF
jgi:LemA protein